MTTLATISLTCSACGHTSDHVAVASTSCFGAPDIDGRPAELARSTLTYWLNECPSCRFAWPRLEPGASPGRLYSLVGSLRYRALDGAPAPERAAWLAAEIGEPVAAGRFWLWRAWAADDAGEAKAATAARLAAVGHWRAARAAGHRLVDDAPALCDALLVAETLRRSGCFGEAVDEAAAAFPFDGPAHVADVLRFVAELAWRRDADPRRLDDATPSGGDPSSRRVRPDAVGEDAEAVVTIHVGDDRLELRRGACASAWFLAGPAGARQVSVWEAFSRGFDVDVVTPVDILHATAREIEASSPALAAEWRLAWRRQRKLVAAGRELLVDAAGLEERLAELEPGADVDLVVGGHDDDWSLERTVAVVLRHACPHGVEPRSVSFEFDGGYHVVVSDPAASAGAVVDKLRGGSTAVGSRVRVPVCNERQV